MEKISTQPYKGSRDFYPKDLKIRNYIFEVFRKVCKSYGYEEYDGPFIEPFELYKAKSGSEIVNEQLYSFIDKGDRNVAIRPEMTPTLARMVAGKQKELIKPIRWFSIPNLWRYEKPQKGRLREHYQLNVDIFGIDTIIADFEIISLLRDILLEFGAKEYMFKVKLGNRKLVEDFFDYIKLNPKQAYSVIKAIDKKPKIATDEFLELLKNENLSNFQIKKIDEMFKDSSKFLQEMKEIGSVGATQVLELLSLLENVEKNSYVEYDSTIIRGFDYYTGNVFEVFDLYPNNKRAIAGGGRYDDLVSIFSSEMISGFGFGMGDVTALNFLTNWDLLPNFESEIDYVVTVWPSNDLQNLVVSSKIANLLRENNKNVILYSATEDKIEKQLKFADRVNAKFAVIIGDEELKNEKITIKDLRNKAQKSINVDSFEKEIS